MLKKNFELKSQNSIFQPSFWWLKSRNTDDTSSATIDNMSPILFLEKKRVDDTQASLLAFFYHFSFNLNKIYYNKLV